MELWAQNIITHHKYNSEHKWEGLLTCLKNKETFHKTSCEVCIWSTNMIHDKTISVICIYWLNEIVPKCDTILLIFLGVFQSRLESKWE